MFPLQVANRSFIAKNVYVCLVVFQVLFLVGLEHDRRDIFCGINALLFHIVGLAIAAWLCFEGENSVVAFCFSAEGEEDYVGSRNPLETSFKI